MHVLKRKKQGLYEGQKSNIVAVIVHENKCTYCKTLIVQNCILHSLPVISIPCLLY